MKIETREHRSMLTYEHVIIKASRHMCLLSSKQRQMWVGYQ